MLMLYNYCVLRNTTLINYGSLFGTSYRPVIIPGYLLTIIHKKLQTLLDINHSYRASETGGWGQESHSPQ